MSYRAATIVGFIRLMRRTAARDWRRRRAEGQSATRPDVLAVAGRSMQATIIRKADAARAQYNRMYAGLWRLQVARLLRRWRGFGRG